MKPETCRTLYHSSIIGKFVGGVLFLYNFFGPRQPKATHISIAIIGVCAITLIILLITKKKWDKQDSDKKDK